MTTGTSRCGRCAHQIEGRHLWQQGGLRGGDAANGSRARPPASSPASAPGWSAGPGPCYRRSRWWSPHRSWRPNGPGCRTASRSGAGAGRWPPAVGWRACWHARGRVEREVIGAAPGSDTVDVHADRDQRRHEVRALRGGVARRSSPRRRNLRHMASCRSGLGGFRGATPCRRPSGPSEGAVSLCPRERPAAASLIPVDDGEVLLQSEELLEATGLVEHRQSRALLDQQEHRVGCTHAGTRIHWGLSPSCTASRVSIFISSPRMDVARDVVSA